jgi:hypothetical protein
LDNFISHGIASHHNDVCHWLIDQFKTELPNNNEFIENWNISLLLDLHPIEEFTKNKYKSLVVSSAKVGNFVFLKYLISKKDNIEAKDKYILSHSIIFMKGLR